MTYESWRISYQSSEAAARSAWQEMIRVHHRANELEAQLSAIGAGGVEPLRKSASQQAAHHAEGVPEQVVELEVDDLIDRLLNAQQDLNLAANVHMDQSIASASTLLDEVEIALRTLAATQPAAQGLDAQTTRDAVIQHLTNAGVLEHDGCGIFIASGDASELIDACMAISTHAHHEKGAAAQAAALLATGGQAQAVERIAIDMKQTAELLDLFGGEPTEFTVMQCNGHSGPGLYAYVTEYPEDGASYLGKTDCEAQPAPRAQAVKLLAADHSGMKVDYRGLFSQVQRALKRTDPGYAEMLRQLEGHLQELGQRWYAGDTDVVDEFLQLYCIERDARKTVSASATAAAQTKQGGAA